MQCLQRFATTLHLQFALDLQKEITDTDVAEMSTSELVKAR